MRLVLAAAVFFTCATAWSAEEARMFQCELPHGKRVDYGNLEALDGTKLQRFEDGPEWSDDGYSGIRPVVVVDRDTMLISWANAVPKDLRGLVNDGRHVNRIPIAGRDAISVWGMTTKSNTATIWRYYLNYNIFYLMELSIGVALQDPLTAPSMAAIYISRCEPM